MKNIRTNLNLITLLFLFTALLFSCKKDDSDKTPVSIIPNNGFTTPPPPSIIPEKGYTTPATYANLKKVWGDEFDGTSLNETFWNYELGNNNGWGNNELENYKKENTSVKDGYLVIQAKNESAGDQIYTSSRLTTQNKYSFKYGRVDIRAALPKGQGIWPALWMLGKNMPQVSWPKCGEVDIMEMIGGGGSGNGSDKTTYGTAHWDNNGSHAQYGGNTKLSSGVFNDEFHVFSIVWDAKKIAWYLDDVKFHEIDTTPAGLSAFQEEYFFIINLAVGGNWPGKPDGTTVLPQQLVVDYIRVFQ